MGTSFRFARRWLPFIMVFMLFSCGGGSGGDDNFGIGSTNDAVIAANSTVPDNVFTATLDTEQGGPLTGSTATGIGVVMIDAASRLMRATLTTSGITGTSAHIHTAPTGSDGSIVFSLTESPSGSGIWTVQTTLTEEQIATLRRGNYYFSVRSAGFPQGELRGQILSQLPASGVVDSNAESGRITESATDGSLINGSTEMPTAGSPGSIIGSPVGIPNTITTGAMIDPAGIDTGSMTGMTVTNANISGNTASSNSISRRTTFVNVLTGTQQTPASGSTAIAIGVAIVDPVSRMLVTSITSIGIAGVSAHIHQALAGSAGDMIFALNETALGSGIWAARLALSEAQVDAFAGGNYYFDIHTASFPNGEIRGQIVATKGTDDFGTGSSGINTNGSASDLVPDSITGTPFADESAIGTGGIDARVPTLGTPTGSGSFTGTSIPTLGNPAGSGIGGASGTGFPDSSGASIDILIQ